MHSALKIQSEIHFVGTDGLHPTGGCWREIQRHDVIVGQCLLNNCLRAKLNIHILEAELHAVFIGHDSEEVNLRSLKGGFNHRNIGFAYLEILVIYENRFVIGIEIRRRIQQAEDDNEKYEKIFPERIAVQHNGFRFRIDFSLPKREH